MSVSRTRRSEVCTGNSCHVKGKGLWAPPGCPGRALLNHSSFPEQTSVRGRSAAMPSTPGRLELSEAHTALETRTAAVPVEQGWVGETAGRGEQGSPSLSLCVLSKAVQIHVPLPSSQRT